jgi:hypothetical protein
MASHFRLRVLLPVAILGVLGLGVGAFAFGRGPASGGDGPLPPLTTHGTTTAATPVDPDVARWTKKADAWCATVNAKVATIEMPKDASDLDLVLAKVVQIQDEAAKAFTALGWPKGKKRTILALRTNLRNSAKASHAAFYALRQADQFAFERAMKRWAELDTSWDSTMRGLGALVCVSETADASSARKLAKYGSAGAALTAALLHRGVVVVLFYAPGDDYDTIQTRETRAGALDAGAGFLALDVTKNDEVAAIASQYDVRDSPATVIFVRGPKVAFRIAGYMDRKAVAQAATDARR